MDILSSVWRETLHCNSRVWGDSDLPNNFALLFSKPHGLESTATCPAIPDRLRGPQLAITMTRTGPIMLGP